MPDWVVGSPKLHEIVPEPSESTEWELKSGGGTTIPSPNPGFLMFSISWKKAFIYSSLPRASYPLSSFNSCSLQRRDQMFALQATGPTNPLGPSLLSPPKQPWTPASVWSVNNLAGQEKLAGAGTVCSHSHQQSCCLLCHVLLEVWFILELEQKWGESLSRDFWSPRVTYWYYKASVYSLRNHQTVPWADVRDKLVSCGQ